MAMSASRAAEIRAAVLGLENEPEVGRVTKLLGIHGAGTNIAMEHAVKSAPDGYTLLINTPPVAINMSLYKNLGFDTVRDLAAISVFSETPNVLVVHHSVPARSVKELIALARAKPRALRIPGAVCSIWEPSPSVLRRKKPRSFCARRSPYGPRW